jgi:hypothetical protein
VRKVCERLESDLAGFRSESLKHSETVHETLLTNVVEKHSESVHGCAGFVGSET